MIPTSMKIRARHSVEDELHGRVHAPLVAQIPMRSAIGISITSQKRKKRKRSSERNTPTDADLQHQKHDEKFLSRGVRYSSMTQEPKSASKNVVRITRKMLVLRGDDHKYLRYIALIVSTAEFPLLVLMLRYVRVGRQHRSKRIAIGLISRNNYSPGVDGISLFLRDPHDVFDADFAFLRHGRVSNTREGIFRHASDAGGRRRRVFLSLDLFLFFLFWKLMLIPMALLIGIWGHERRVYAAVKFILYTMAGLDLHAVGIIWLYNATNTFDLPTIQNMLATGLLALSPRTEMLLFLAFFVAFAIKVPVFPLHTWLPDAHVEAPTAGSVMLAGVLLRWAHTA